MLDLKLVLGALLAGVSAGLPFLPPAFPRVAGPRIFYQLPRVQTALSGLALALAVSASFQGITPGRLAWLSLVSLLAFHALLYPHRMLVALDSPLHLRASQAGIGEEARVLEMSAGGEARAWLMDMLLPRHLINDRIGGTPVLAAY
ncbi:MAG: DUF3179 domain-containing protein [Planctomycetes bacterium]|nr:DUF3179 domain-containing protein [Planctomycetota bacterium]